MCILEQNFIFVGRISIATSHTLLTLLYYTILYYTTLHYTILYYTILYYTILYYTILFLGQKVVLYLLEVKLESKIKQFYHTRSEDSAVNAYDKSRRLLWISWYWFCTYFKRLLFPNTFRWLFLQRKKDIFNNHNVYDKKRCLHGSKKSTQNRPKKVFDE